MTVLAEATAGTALGAAVPLALAAATAVLEVAAAALGPRAPEATPAAPVAAAVADPTEPASSDVAEAVADAEATALGAAVLLPLGTAVPAEADDTLAAVSGTGAAVGGVDALLSSHERSPTAAATTTTPQFKPRPICSIRINQPVPSLVATTFSHLNCESDALTQQAASTSREEHDELVNLFFNPFGRFDGEHVPRRIQIIREE